MEVKWEMNGLEKLKVGDKAVLIYRNIKTGDAMCPVSTVTHVGKGEIHIGETVCGVWKVSVSTARMTEPFHTHYGFYYAFNSTEFNDAIKRYKNKGISVEITEEL
jgi:hypothetical protein